MPYLMVILEVPEDPEVVDPMDSADYWVDQGLDARICDAMWDPVIQRRRDPWRKRWLTEFQECFED